MKGTVLEARGLASMMYTISSLIANWIFINPFVSSALAILTVCSLICCITSGPRLKGGKTAELSPE